LLYFSTDSTTCPSLLIQFLHSLVETDRCGRPFGAPGGCALPNSF
jgi:hypothetical protein